MPAEKPLVFLSHINEEKELAIAFKNLIETSFLEMLEVFVSSDEDSIRMGQKWLDRISSGLRICSIEIVLCSPKSIKRPWINFEAGAGWVRDIPVIPLCHSGMEPSKLPTPLNLLQAAKANEISSLKLIFPVLAQAIRAKPPCIDFTDFVSRVINFESKYTFWDDCNSAFEKLDSMNSTIVTSLKQGNDVQMDVTETEINLIIEATEMLRREGLVTFSRSGGVTMSGRGVTHRYLLSPRPSLAAIVSDPNFRF